MDAYYMNILVLLTEDYKDTQKVKDVWTMKVMKKKGEN